QTKNPFKCLARKCGVLMQSIIYRRHGLQNIMRLISSTLLFLSLCGCAGSLTGECGDKFILLWNGEFREVQVTTLASPYELRGAAAEIYYNAPIRYEGYTGRVARPKLSRTGDGVCVPLDVNSSMALTVY